MTFEDFVKLLPWILPPLLGAIIGYVTNAIAIKMLFRPLTEKRIFNIPIPFTPGIIPRQRAQLAVSIGNMVSDNLLTVDALNAHISAEGFKAGLRDKISSLSGDLISKPVSSIDENQLALFYESMENFIHATINRLLKSEGCLNMVKGFASNLITSFSNIQFKKVMKTTNLKEVLVSYIFPFLSGEPLRDWLTRELEKWIETNEDKSLGEIIPVVFLDDIAQVFKTFLPDVLDALFNWLRTPDMKNLLETQGGVLLNVILTKLNVIQQFFVSVTQYDKTLHEKIPEIVDDALFAIEKGVKNRERQEAFVDSLKAGILKWEEKRLGHVIGPDVLKEKGDWALNKILDTLTGEKVRDYIVTTIDLFVEENEDKSVKELLAERFDFDMNQLVEYVHSLLENYLSNQESIDKIGRVLFKTITGLIEGIKDTTLERLFDIRENQKKEMDRFLFEQSHNIIKAKLPDIIKSLNIKEVVVNKINSLNIEEVEKLLLMVIEKHLKWINVFGAILGAFIGFSQILVQNLVR